MAGSLDITELSEFRVDALFSTWQINLLHLETQFVKEGGQHKWSSSGHMSGRVKFGPPKGRSASEMKETSELFNGVVAEFENLNPVDLGSAPLRFTFPPKQFEVAKIFLVDMRGLEFPDGVGDPSSFKLIGDVNIRNLPGIDAELTFGGIRFSVGSPPQFTIEKIGAGLSVGSAFSGRADFRHFANPQERGFKGGVSLQTQAIGELTGRLKLAQVRTLDNRDWVPSIALYLGTDLELPLFAEFYLRKLGAGMGIFQALRGLESTSKNKPLRQRIDRFVDDPRGLPHPGEEGSWVPSPPKRRGEGLKLMLVGNGLITFTRLKPPNPDTHPHDLEHPLTLSLTLAVDQDFDIVAGVNAWPFTSPNQATRPDFLRNPAARGALAISPKERSVYAYFRTLKNARMGDRAPDLLRQVLDQGETSLRFLADPNGFILEIGWPWETKFDYEFGRYLKGELRLGQRYGIYRGVISFGQNFAINVKLEAEKRVGFGTRLGRAEAILRADGKAYFRTSFIGALSPSFQPYLFGDVRLGATVNLRAEARCSLSKKICGIKIRLRIRFSRSLSLSISAALTAAMDNSGVGFEGDAQVAVSVCGFRLAGRVPFRMNPEKISSIKDQLDRLLPPGLTQQNFPTQPPARKPRVYNEDWQYRFTRVRKGTKTFIRVLLFPAARAVNIPNLRFKGDTPITQWESIRIRVLTSN